MSILHIETGEERNVLRSTQTLENYRKKHGDDRIYINYNYQDECDLTGLSLSALVAPYIDLSNVNLSYTSFNFAKLIGARIASSTCEKVNFSNTDLQRAIFFCSNLRDSSFREANLRGATFERSDLTTVNFENADLTNSIFKDCKTYGARVKGADFSGAKFIDTDFAQ